jgi:hypothetical protein
MQAQKAPEFKPQSHQKKKIAGGIAQMIKHLPSKHKALSSKLRTAKKKKKPLNVNLMLKSFLFGGTLGFIFAKKALCHFRHTSSPFCSGYFGYRLLQTIWPRLTSN